MIPRFPASPTIDLSANSFETPIRIELQAYLDFCFWMSEELLDLEARFGDKDKTCSAYPKAKH